MSKILPRTVVIIASCASHGFLVILSGAALLWMNAHWVLVLSVLLGATAGFSWAAGRYLPRSIWSAFILGQLSAAVMSVGLFITVGWIVSSNPNSPLTARAFLEFAFQPNHLDRGFFFGILLGLSCLLGLSLGLMRFGEGQKEFLAG